MYTNTLHHGYVLDDFSAIKENNIVRQGLPALKEIFKTSYRQGYASINDDLYYRPLSLATFAVEWHFFPDRPGVGHAVNVVLYGITGALLFLMLCKLFQFPSGDESQAEALAFIASLLFITHPLHVEVVANIKSRDEMLCFLFVICSFSFAFRHLETGRVGFLILAMLTYFVSLLSKETSITALALLPIAIHFCTPVSIRKNIITTSVFLVAALAYLMIWSFLLHGVLSDPTVAMTDNVMVGAKTLSTRLGTGFYILGLYVKLLLLPHPLSYDYSFNHIAIVSLGNVFSILSLLFYAAIGSYAAFVLCRSFKGGTNGRPGTEQRAHILVFGILFFLVTIFLFSNLVLTIGTSMGDRLMYFPSLGFCICIAFLFVRFLKIEAIDIQHPTSSVKLLPVLAVAVLFSAKTWSRNFDWKDNYTLYSHDVNIVPNSVKAHYYLGRELVKTVADAEQNPQKKADIYEQGIAQLEKAVQIYPTFAIAYTQMGVAYSRMKNYEKAIANYYKAAELKPSDATTLSNIGAVYFEWQKYPEAKEKFQQALRINARSVDTYMNLGMVLGTMGDLNGAIDSFQNAIHFAPDNARAYFFIAVTYSSMGDRENADKYFQIARRMDPKLRPQ